MADTITLDPGLLAGLDSFLKQRVDDPPLTREDAANTIIRDWLQGQGFLALPGEGRHKTAAAAAGVPRGHLDP